MEDSAESVLPTYHEAVDPVGIEGLGLGSQGRRSGQRPVCSMLVVVPLVLPKRMPEVSLVPDQRAVQQNRPAVSSPSVP